MKKFFAMILYTLCGIAGSIILGFAIYRSSIFATNRLYFYFVSFGIIGALTLALARFYRVWIAALFVLVFSIILLVTLQILNFPNLAILVLPLWYLGVGYTIFGVGCIFRTKVRKLPIGKFLILAVALALIFVVKTFATYIPFTKQVPFGEITFNALLGFYIGCGLGIGVEIGELLGRAFIKREEVSSESK